MGKNPKDFIEMVVKELVDYPNDISIKEVRGARSDILELHVAEQDVGKVIGKYGRNAKALRTLLNAIATKEHRRINLDIIDKKSYKLLQSSNFQVSFQLKEES